MRVRPFILGAALAGAALLLAACSSPSSPTPTGTAHPGQLVGTWTVDQTFDTPEQPFIAFVQDGTWTASDGCNRVQGTWDLAADGSLSTTAGPSTLIGCDGAQLPTAVALADEASVDGDTLSIVSSHDASTTTLVRSTDSAVGLQGFPVGYWVESRTPDSPFLTISADRTYSGDDGCNRFTGAWESTGDGAVALTAGATTLMACEGVDTWLSQAASAVLRSGTLTVSAADGTVLGQLIAPTSR
jgi:heat shock protein HslJ